MRIGVDVYVSVGVGGTCSVGAGVHVSAGVGGARECVSR